MYVCVCVCVCVCMCDVRACVYVYMCMRVCEYVCVPCACVSVRVMCVHANEKHEYRQYVPPSSIIWV